MAGRASEGELLAQVLVDSLGGLSAGVDGVGNQRGARGKITCREDVADVCGVISCDDVAVVVGQAKLLGQVVIQDGIVAEGEQGHVGLEAELRVRHLVHDRPVGRLCPPDVNGTDFGQSGSVAAESFGRYAPASVHLRRMRFGRAEAVAARLGTRVAVRQDLQLVDLSGALEQCGFNAVVAGFTAADDDDGLVLGRRHSGSVRGGLDGQDARGAAEEIEGKVDSILVSSGHIQVAGLAGPRGQQYGVEAVSKRPAGDIPADAGARLEGYALGLELIDSAIDEMLSEAEVGNAVSQEPAGQMVFSKTVTSCPAWASC